MAVNARWVVIRGQYMLAIRIAGRHPVYVTEHDAIQLVMVLRNVLMITPPALPDNDHREH